MKVWGFGLRFLGAGLGVKGLGFGVWGVGCRVYPGHRIDASLPGDDCCLALKNIEP